MIIYLELYNYIEEFLNFCVMLCPSNVIRTQYRYLRERNTLP